MLVSLGLIALSLSVIALFPSTPGCPGAPAAPLPMARIHALGHELYAGVRPWRAWGFNWGIDDRAPVIAYLDHPSAANLGALACELHTARRLGANSMRVYLELQQVMQSPTVVRPSELEALRRLLDLATRDRIYLDITGDLVWRPGRAPVWYDRLSERSRWQVQATFWRAVAHTAAGSPAVLCYELTSEPLISDAAAWYTGAFGGWSFLQVIAHPHGRNPRQLARAWTALVAGAVRSQDDRPVTIGLLPSAGGGFAPGNVADLLDMLVVHQYPRTGQAAEAVAPIRYFASFGKPVLLGETFPLVSDLPTQRAFLMGANPYLVGAFEFFDGRDPYTMRVRTATDAIYASGLRQFVTLRETILKPT
ncbi:MAG: hypothetical protein ACXVSE_08480 [Solirubrobacteraceae bacterium]